jgi:Holliday junction DNA helicase RuvA
VITKITGKLLRLADDSATLAIEPFEYDVSVPEYTRRQLQSQLGDVVSLHTIHYMEGDPSRGRVTPKLVAFISEVEREFFEMFCSVDGVGPKKALRAMGRPVQDIAVMIEEQDAKGLSSLPGIGAAIADRSRNIPPRSSPTLWKRRTPRSSRWATRLPMLAVCWTTCSR